MCKLLNQYDALKTMIVLIGSYDLNFIGVEDLEEIEDMAEQLDVKITDFFNEIDGMYNSQYDEIEDIFCTWNKEINTQYLECREKIEKILCK